jgi:riboflavin kinase/FMN adenylyltransferase
VRPTFGGGDVTVETFLLEGSHDLYGRPMRLAFVKRLREEQRFDDVEALKARMAEDCADARDVLRRVTL